MSQLLDQRFKNYLKPITRDAKKKTIVAFDIEATVPKAEFLLGCIAWYEKERGRYSKDYQLKEKTFRTQRAMIEFLKTYYLFRKSDTVLLAHNMQYDILGLFQEEKDLEDMDILLRGSRMIQAKLKVGKELKWTVRGNTYKYRHKIKFYDTLNHTKTSLAKIGDILHLPKSEHPTFFGTKPDNEEDWKILEDYCKQDTLICLKWGIFLEENYNTFNSSLKCTIGSNAMDIYRRNYLKQPILQPTLDQILNTLKAMRGGRTEVFQRGTIKKKLNYYDFNSLYPAMMLKEYPDPNNYFETTHVKMTQLDKYEGVCYAELISPYQHIPYLGVKHKLGISTKLVFPIGKIKGYFTLFELRECIKRDYQITLLGHGILYNKLHKPFREYVTDLYVKRSETTSQAMNYFYKGLMNNLYGKWGQKPEPEPDIKLISSYHADQWQRLWESDKEISIVGNWVYVKNKLNPFRIPSFTNPIYSVYVTAYARHHLHLHKPKNLVYCDTDSYITPDKMNTGSFLGELKLELEIDEAVIIKPKLYRINDIVKTKGLGRMNALKFEELLVTKQASYDRIVKMKEGIRRNLKFNESLEVVKNIDLEDNKREWKQKFDSDEHQFSEPLLIK